VCGVSESSSTILKEVVGEVISKQKCKHFYRFSIFSELRSYNFGVAFFIAIVNFLQSEYISF
jgi:galactitol-specific phosphotransferase system IIB component